jgi:ankyrin repeat protein
MALFLLERGARLDLFAASMLGYVDVLTAASKSPGFISSRGAHEIPLLSHAVAGQATTAVDFLLASGADVNARHQNGMTALMIAVQTGQRETVRLLLSKGADPNLKAINGQSALALSLKGNQPAIAGDLRGSGATE